MALKDAIDKIVSYFDTDEVTDYEDAAKGASTCVYKIYS